MCVCVCVYIYIYSPYGFTLRDARSLQCLLQYEIMKSAQLYRFRQKYLMIWQHNCEWNCWHGEFVLERPSSETQSISVSMERWSVEHWAFAVETYF